MHKLKHLIEFNLFESFKFVGQNFRDLFQKLEDEGMSEDDAHELWKRIYSARQALRNQQNKPGKTREQQIQTSETLEEVLDVLARAELVSRAIKWHKLVPSKYRKQLKERIEEFADKIADYTDYEDYKDKFLPPIAAALRDVDTFFTLLDNHIKGLSGTLNKIVSEINRTPGIEIETLLKEQIIAWVYHFKAACSLGTSSWCIARDDGYFDSYITNEFRKQYIVWDFRYDTTNKKYLNALTLNNDMSIYHAAWKDNRDNYTAQQQFPNEPWFKYLTPLAPEQTRKWIVSLKDKNISNPKTAVLIAAELDEIETFTSLLKKNINSFDHDFVSRIIDIINDKASSEMLEALKDATKNTTNYKIALKIAAEFNDLGVFKSVFTGDKKTESFDDKIISDLAQKLVRDNSFDMLEVIGDNHPTLLTANGAKPLILAYELKNAKIFNYLKSKVNPKLIQTLQKLLKARNHPSLQEFLDTYHKSL